MTKVPTIQEIDVEKIRRGGFYQFIKRAWSQIEPVAYVDNWHIEEKAKFLEACTKGEFLDGVINEPPGMGKSLVVSVLWPAWEWTVNPKTAWIFASYDQRLSNRDAGKCVGLIQSEWYQSRWPHVKLAERMNGEPRKRVSLQEHYTTEGGMRFSTSIPLGRVTGRHGNRIVVDDPIKPATAEAASFSVSEKALQGISDWRKNTIATRARDPKTLSKMLIMQRVHENDMSGEMQAEGAQTLRFPARFEADDPSITPFARDQRKIDGELLFPARMDEATLTKYEKNMGGRGSMTVEAQFQQRPTSRTGQIYKREWFQYWKELPKGFGRFVQSWDLTFKKEGTSRVCGDLWLIFGPKFYLIDWVCRRMSFTEMLEEIKTKCLVDQTWKQAGAKLIENKANGPAVISVLEHMVSGIIPVEPQGSKEERAAATTPPYEARNVFHPDPSIRPDIVERENVLAKFPRYKVDDEVDATSQFMLYAMQNTSSLLEAMSRGSGILSGFGVR